MRGLTWSPRAYRFGRVPPYHIFYLRQQAQTFVEDSLCKIVIPNKTTAAKCPVYLLRLCDIGIDAEFVAIFHFGTSHILLAFYVLLDD